GRLARTVDRVAAVGGANVPVVAVERRELADTRQWVAAVEPVADARGLLTLHRIADAAPLPVAVVVGGAGAAVVTRGGDGARRVAAWPRVADVVRARIGVRDAGQRRDRLDAARPCRRVARHDAVAAVVVFTFRRRPGLSGGLVGHRPGADAVLAAVA